MSNDIEKTLSEFVEPDEISKRKNGINSKKKGNRGELELVHILNERFKGHSSFARSPSSGAFVGGDNRERSKNLPFHAKLSLVSDIITDEKFNFVIEHKFYGEVNFWNLLGETSEWDKWWKQASGDAAFVEREPIVIIKYNGKKRLVLLKQTPIKPLMTIRNEFSVFWLDDLLALDDKFWFKP
jgi:hypothetical protein